MSGVVKQLVGTRNGHTHVSEAGTGGQTIAFITITSFASAFMERVLRHFAARGHRALSLDIMGYGGSDRRKWDFTIADFADSIEEALIAVDAARPDCLVFGHFSALIGIEIAARASVRARGLVLDGVPIAAIQDRRDYAAGKRPEPVRWDIAGSHAAEFWRHTHWILSHLDPDLVIPEIPDQVLREAFFAISAATGFEPKTYHAYMTFPIEERLAAVKGPVLVMTSEADWNCRHFDTLMAALPQAQGIIWPRAHPLHQLGRPDRIGEYADRLENFLRYLPKA